MFGIRIVLDSGDILFLAVILALVILALLPKKRKK